MKYSKYFGALVRENGQPNLSVKQFQRMMNIIGLCLKPQIIYKFQRMMNIIAIENKIEGLLIAKELNKNRDLYYQYDMNIFKYDKVLTKLTGNQKPVDLIKEMRLQFEY